MRVQNGDTVAIKLTVAEQKTMSEHVTALRAAQDNLSVAKEVMDAKIGEAVAAFNVELASYEVKRVAAETTREAIAERLRSEYDEKSENWQGGDKGSEADAFISEWEGIESESPDEIETPEIDVSITDDDYADNLEALPSEP